MTFSEILRNLIEENSLTQKQLASELNISQSTIGGYVQGTREPDFETLKLFARYFRVSPNYLLSFPSGMINTPREQEILRIFRSLSDEQQLMFIEQGKAILKINHRNQTQESEIAKSS